MLNLLSFKTPTIVVVLFISACGLNAPREPSIEKIKEDLIGKTIGNPFFDSWTFRSLSEIESIKIVDKHKGENIIEYQTDAILRSIRGGSYEGRRYTASLGIVYRLDGNQWTMISLTAGGNGVTDAYREIQK